MKTIRLLLFLAATLPGRFQPLAAETPNLQLTIETNWPALSQPIVDLFVPPTRLREAYAATKQQVFHVGESRTNWGPVYDAPLSATIFGLSGYAKASSVLYVVHSSGIARTRDDGTSWLETVPQDYGNPADSFLGISVNPTNRREAALAFRGGAWLTRDFGESFTHLSLPADGALLDIAYAGADTGILVILTDRAMHLTTTGGENWVSLPHENSGRAVLATSAKLPAAIVAAGQHGLTAYDLSRPGFRRVLEVRDFNACDKLVADCSGRGLLWAACGPQLRILGMTGERVESMTSYVFDQTIRVLREHPRLPDQAFCATDGQVVLARIDSPLAMDALTNLWNLAAFTPGPLQEAKAQDTPRAATAQPEVQELLSQLAAAEPPLGELLDAALKHARFSGNDIIRWKKRAKVRNWLPQFRVGGGVREYTVDQSEIYNYVDRYGIPQRNDLRLSDNIEPMAYVGGTLVWDLSRLLYDPEEVDINQEKRNEMTQRNTLSTQLTTLYYERLELLVRARFRSEKMGLDERISTQIKLRQKTDLLNNLCGQPLLRSPATP